MVKLLIHKFLSLKYIYQSFNNSIKLKYYKVSYDSTLKVIGNLFIYSKGITQLGKNVKINSSLDSNPIGGDSQSIIYVKKGASLTIGSGTGISNSSIVVHHSVSIGKNVLLGGSTKIYDTDFHSLDANNRKSDNDQDIKVKPVIIGDDVFIGAHSIILKGTVIGDNSIIGAGSVVAGTIPSNEIWAGNPAKFIRKLSIEDRQ